MTYEQERRLAVLLYKDSFYQELLAECKKRALDYHRIMNSLSMEDQELLELYIAVCEELEYRRACLAATLAPF